MSFIDQLKTGLVLPAWGALLPSARRRRGPKITISRWPRGRRRMRALFTLLGLVVVLGAGLAVSLLVLGPAPALPEPRQTMRACIAETTCVEWRVLANCTERVLPGWRVVRQQALHTFARSPQEAAWMVLHFENGCEVERVEPQSIRP